MMESHPFLVVPSSPIFHDKIARLQQEQEARLHARDPYLRLDRSLSWFHVLLQVQEAQEQCPPLLVLDSDDQVRAYAVPGVWELSEDSVLHAFLTEKNGIARSLTLPNPAVPGARAIVSDLLSALSHHWQRAQSTGDLIRWPSRDVDWVAPILKAHGFLEDSVCAFRPLDAPPIALLPVVSSLQLREAQPADKTALVRLFEEELRVHAQCTPFARVSPTAIEGFRRKVARRFHGGTLEDGAPLVLVAAIDGEVVGMAECTLLRVDPDAEPGFTPPGRYGCLDNVCVAEAVRGQGVGAKLTRAALAALGTLPSLKGYLLWYSPGNPLASRFWPRFGFVPLWTTFQRLRESSSSLR